MKLYTIGVGGPPPSPIRFGSSFILAIQNEYIMIDCGPATTYKMTHLGLFPTYVNTVFLTHHHFDHNADLPCFVLSRWDHQKGDEEPLRIFGPPPTEDVVEKLFGKSGAFRPDLEARVNHPVSKNLHRTRGGLLPRRNLELNTKEIDPGTKVQGKNWEALCAEVHHVQPYLRSYGYRINTKEGAVVFTGDAGASAEIEKLVEGAEAWITGCALGKDRTKIPQLAEISIGTEEVAQHANRGKVKKVILTHMLESAVITGSREKIAIEVSKGYDGPVLVPTELEAIPLP